MRKRLAVLTPALVGLLFLAACARPPEEARKPAEEPTPKPPAVEEKAPPPEVKKEAKEAARKEEPSPNVFKVRFDTSKGPFVVEVHRDWAPLGAARFEQLVKDGFYDGARFFRIVPNFVVQFGLAASPAMTRKWDKPIKDDPVTQTNRLGAITFATSGPNTRTTQLFINLRSNAMLDSQGFAPFGRVVEGMDVVEKLYPGYGEQPDQDLITRRGNKYLEENFPKLDYIKKATIL